MERGSELWLISIPNSSDRLYDRDAGYGTDRYFHSDESEQPPVTVKKIIIPPSR